MGGYDLSVDMDALKTLASDLKSIEAEFKDANDNANDAAEETGNDELADRVTNFASKWRIKRNDMLDNVSKLQQILEQITETFEHVDGELAKALEEKAEG